MGGSGRNPGVSCGVAVRNRALRYRGAEKEKEKQRFSCDRLCRRSARPKAVLDRGRAVGVTYDSLTSWRSFSSTSSKQSKRHQHRHCVASKIVALLCSYSLRGLSLVWPGWRRTWVEGLAMNISNWMLVGVKLRTIEVGSPKTLSAVDSKVHR